MRDPSLGERIAALAERATRAEASAALARALGAEELVVLVRDAELDVLVPAPGFSQTLRGGAKWRALVDAGAAPGRHRAEVDLPAGSARPAVAIARPRIVAVLVGGAPSEAGLAELEVLLPLLAAAFCAELEAVAAAAAATEAGRAATRASALAEALEAARAEGAKLNARLREEHRRKDEFLAMLSHELRNPLAPIVASLDLLRHRALPPEQVDRQLDVMQRQVTQLTRLVEDLLDVSRVSLGRVELRRQPTPLREILEGALEASRPLLDARRHRVALALPDEPVLVNADHVRLLQVFANLLHNAAKYTDPGGRVELSAERQGNEALVRVTDNGIGMAPEFVPRVFDLFAQAPVALGRAHGGLGIGLTLVRALVEMHGGRVSAASAGLGRGSTFEVRFPVVQAAGARAAAAPAPEPSTQAALRVLVIDDNVDAADTLAALLRAGSAHHVEVAYSGLGGVQAAGDLAPDIVFLDIGLPDIDGFEVAQRIRRSSSRATRCIALTGYGGEEARQRASEAGFDDHVVKPASMERLLEIVNRVAAERSGRAAA